MTHIALVPLGRKFLEEHLTLVWMGNATQMHRNRAEHLVQLINAYIGDSRHDETLETACFQVYSHDDTPYRNFSGTMVAAGTVSKVLQHFRQTATHVGINASTPPWTPHITGQNGAWRHPLEAVVFSHAEIR